MLTVLQGDCLEKLRELPAESMDSCVTDPSYELGFMGKSWDSTGIAFNSLVWREVLRVLKPGAHLLAFGGTRTYHRMVCAIEDAGFEIRDQIGWLYGSGFPKSLDISKAIDKSAGATREVISKGKPVKRMIPGADQDKTGSWLKDNGREHVPTVMKAATPEAKQWEGWGTALKPAWEPIVVARKPLIGTVVSNVLAHGTGGINISGCRIPLNGDYKSKANGRPSQTGLGDNYDPSKANQPDTFGRWPANIIHDGSDEVMEEFSKYGSNKGAFAPVRGTEPTADGFSGSVYGDMRGRMNQSHTFHGDTGTAARFFYCAKAGWDDREDWNTHPTVKPTALMRYLCRLVTPPGGVILDPFAGSGTTGRAAIEEGFNSTLIELNPDYIPLIERRTTITKGLGI